MSGLMRRLTRGRAATDDEGTPQATAASEPVSATTDAQQGGASLPANGSVEEEPKTAVLAGGDGTKEDAATAGRDGTKAAEVARDLPAGVDPAELAAAPTSAKRSRVRRRLRYLRAVREILLRDVGGFYYEAQRSEQGVDPHRRLLDAKTARLARLDEEVRDLESRLEESHPQTVLRQPGLGGTCPQCGELHSSDARFCSRCGTALGGRRARSTTSTGATAAPVPAPSGAGEDAKATTASLWGRPKRPDPAASPDGATQAAPDEARVAPDEARVASDEAHEEPAVPPAAEPAPAPDEPAPTGSERA
jgi:hypothetical protein